MTLADEGAFSIIVVVDVKVGLEGIVWPRLEVNAFIGCCGSSWESNQLLCPLCKKAKNLRD